MTNEEDLVYRLRKRAEIRRQIPGRKSVQEGKADRMADLLDEAAKEIEKLRDEIEGFWQDAAGASL
jgi:predicted translin family RNA/ssDNA-binding protein